MVELERAARIVLDTNVLVAAACRRHSSAAHELMMGILEERFPVILTSPILAEYRDVLNRPAIMQLTRLTHTQNEELLTDLVSLSKRIQVLFSWHPNLRDESDNKFVDAAIHTAAAIVTYNLKDFSAPDMIQHGWSVMTPQQYLTKYRIA